MKELKEILWWVAVCFGVAFLVTLAGCQSVSNKYWVVSSEHVRFHVQGLKTDVAKPIDIRDTGIRDVAVDPGVTP